MRTTFALISKYEDAKQVVDQLMDKNIGKESINVIAQKSAVESAWNVNQRTIDVDVTNAVGQKTVQGLDALLGRQHPVRTQSAGDLYAAGELAEIIAKTVSGAGEISDLKDALVDFGVSDPAAEQYSNGIRSGEMLVFIRTDDENSGTVRTLLDGSSGVKHSSVIG